MSSERPSTRRLQLTPQQLLEGIAEHPALAGSRRFVIAFSGGLDSTVLLDLCRRALPRHAGARLLAVHIDHDLQAASSEWAQHCELTARHLGVALASKKIEVQQNKGDSPEAAARQARYAALTQYLEPGDVLLTGHHQEDQLETVLLQLLRGSGIAGLAGMPELSPFGPGWHFRPMLSTTRVAVAAYAESAGLKWLDDPSNQSLRYDRNFLRHTVLPLLTQRWPAVAATTARTAQHCGMASKLLRELGDADVNAISSQRHTADIDRLQRLSPERQQNAIRQWLSREGYATPGTVHLREIMQLLPDDTVSGCVSWADVEVRRFRQQLYIMHSVPSATKTYRQSLQPDSTVSLPPGLGQIVCSAAKGGLDPQQCANNLLLRFRAGGEKLRPVGGKHRRELSKLFQEAGVVPWMRDRIPLVYAGERLAAVADLWLEQDLVVAPGDPGLGLTWKMHPALY